MLVSYKWLKSLVPDLTATPHEIEEKMSTTGIEVEGFSTPAEGLSKLVVGEIISFEDIPETHLHLCKVDVGDTDLLQIVCGAPNVLAGNKAIVALIGARIKDNIKIKKGKMRGFESQGMLCALDEIGVPDSINPMKHEEGIYVMPADAENGESIFPYLDMDDSIIELSITPNRADALSMRGVAYEVGAIYDLPVKFESRSLTEADKATKDKISVAVNADIADKVPTYKIRLIEGVKIAPSPVWLQNRLMNAGIRPINNVVDVTNYILMDYGQPLHAFDFSKLGAEEILVRAAQNGEKMRTLDAEERELTENDLVISSANRPVALAGVMGGLESEITSETKTVALESAIFNGTSIRKTSQKFSLRSEASQRFEKGINEGTVRESLDAAAALITELAGGRVLKGVAETNDYRPASVSVDITLEKINQALGTNLSADEVRKIFKQLGFGVEGEFHVTIPPRRWDIAIEADLVEEVARIYGYDRLPSTLPAGENAGELTPIQQFRRRIRSKLEASGLSEVIGYSLMSAQKAVEFIKEDISTTSLMLPMTEDRQTLRVSMLSGLLDMIAYNQNRKNSDVAIYEIGNIFMPSESEDGRPKELPNIAFAISGNVEDRAYNHSAKPADFYYAKGIVEELLSGYESINFEPLSDNPFLHPGRSARIELAGTVIGFVGQIHPKLEKQYGIAESYVAELDLNLLFEAFPEQVTFKEIPKIQAVTRDLSLLLDEGTSHAQVVTAIHESKAKSLVKAELFDLYTGEKLPAGKKSMAYTLTFQGKEQSLTDEEINRAFEKITKNLIRTLHVEVR